MNLRLFIVTIALLAGLVSASAVTWVAPRDFAVPVSDVPSAPPARHLPGAVVTLKLTVGPACRVPHAWRSAVIDRRCSNPVAT